MSKFLIIRFSSIGDIVLTTPVVRCLKKQIPGVEVHYCTKKQYAAILEHNPYIDKLHVLEDDFNTLTGRLKQERYDQVIDLHNSLRSHRLKLALGKPSRTFNKINFRKWMKVHFKIDRLPAVHIVDRYLHTLDNWDVKNDLQGLDYFFPAEAGIDKDSLPVPYRKGYIAMAVGAKHFTKQPPPELMVEIIQQLKYPVILLGGPEDRIKAERIAAHFPEKVMNTCGSITLHQSASLVKNALAVITPDTGLMHIAAAFRKIIISLWGNTIPEFGMTPYLPDARSRIFEVKNLSCRPCSKLGYPACPKGHFNCMKLMPAGEIAAYTNSACEWVISHAVPADAQ